MQLTSRKKNVILNNQKAKKRKEIEGYFMISVWDGLRFMIISWFQQS